MAIEFDIESENTKRIGSITKHLTTRMCSISERVAILEEALEIQTKAISQILTLQKNFSEHLAQLLKIVEGGKKDNGQLR